MPAPEPTPPESAPAAAPAPRWRRGARWLLRWTPRAGLLLLALGVAAWRLLPFNEGRLRESQGNGALQVLDAAGVTVGWRAGRDGNWRLPVRLAAMPPRFLAATVAAEDKRFYDHRGVDFLAVARAARQNVTNLRRVSGASTLTMQTIRLLHPRPRTWFAKAREALAALQLERIADKARILETYCNLAPYGGNVIGVQAAALRYFGKNAAELTLGEAALLAGIPQSPARFNPRKHLNAALKRREFVLERMVALEYATPGDAARARAETIVIRDPAAEECTQVPGLTEWVARARPEGGVQRTTVDPAAQAVAAAAAARHYRRLRALGIDGLAVMVIDVRESSLAALVGNPAPADPRHGQLNGALTRRQPGSLLKPFIYAAAFQRGVCVPDTMVEDRPREWNGYRPENMDRLYLGRMTAAEALRLSRNLPAVATLEATGRETVAELLRGAGLTLPDTERLGMTLALGTQEMRLADLTNAYAALARLGEWRPLRILRETPAGAPRAGGFATRLTAEAAWLTLQALAESDAPAAAWKTGTSWNHRDGWAIAVSPRHAVGVWTGNWDGAGNEHLGGAATALPLAQEILSALGVGETWPRPAGIRETALCPARGLLPGVHCRERKTGFTIAGVSPRTVCTACRQEPADAPDDAGRITDGTVADMSGKKADKGKPGGAGPRLLSPARDGVYILAPGAPTVLPLQAAADGEVTWYVDGREVARTASGAVHSWTLIPGAHHVTAVDAAGRATRADFTVRRLE